MIKKKVDSGQWTVDRSSVKAFRAFTSTREEGSEKNFSLFPNAVEANPKHSGGFTLIETLVAVSILLVSLTGPLSIAAQALQSAYYSRDQITAFYLAQEGIEYMRVRRDQNYLANQQNPNWVFGIDNCFDVACSVDFPKFKHAVCDPTNGCAPLLITASDEKLFNTESGTPSPFTRSVTLKHVAGNADELIIEVTVAWLSAGIDRSFTITERMFNWL